ncbi:neuronal acetylcholine receptor subunit alpha-7 [Plakobranchus ocellatus]|uniref:Neuronal acetylcholine receptor subunit alpha-7 n=1 Tax=Plakobranchus ocellatus TaxID=259542 RepID=A0AAV4DW54_9GAST|nr:neuronal acetylcholine receptor subunit alpha-7 [Plakobranchus ocellatus]
MRTWVFSVAFLCWFDRMRPTRCQTYENVYNLEQAIFRNYSPTIRPVIDQSKAIEIAARFVIISFPQVDEVEQVFSVNGALWLTWIDEILRWNPSDYGNASLIFPDRLTVWRPRIVILNTAGKRDIFEDDHQPLKLFPNGQVIWVPGGIFPVTCKFNMRKFPFDKQSCVVTMVAMHGFSDSITFTVPSDGISFRLYSQNPGWSITASSLDTVLNSMDVPFYELQISLTFSRRPAFFVLSILLPVNLVAILDILVFLIPIETGERIGVSLTVLLAQTVYMSITSTYLPTASDSIPLVVFFLMIMTIMAVFTVAMCILFAWLHHKEEEEQRRGSSESIFKSTFRKLRKLTSRKAHPENPSRFHFRAGNNRLNSIEKTTRSNCNAPLSTASTHHQNGGHSVMQSHTPLSEEYLTIKRDTSGSGACIVTSISSKDRHSNRNQIGESMYSCRMNHCDSSSVVKNTLCHECTGRNTIVNGTGKYKAIVTFLEQTCLFAFLLFYCITLFAFLIVFLN